jgi:nucleoside-diphosphate-sugar epimerase
VLVGDGENRWSIAHVDNVVEPMRTLADAPGVGPLLVADAVPVSQRRIAETIARALGRSTHLPRVPRSIALAFSSVNARIPRPPEFPPPFSPHHVALRTRERIFVTDKARALGVSPRTTFEEGMRAAIDWYRSA